MMGTPYQPRTILHDREYLFRLRLPGWESFKLERLENGNWLVVTGRAASCTSAAGLYRLAR
jgi:hypothetical protein